MKLWLSSLLLACLIALPAQASPNLDQAFRETFVSGYRGGACGQNINNLLELAKARGEKIESYTVLHLRNEGMSNLGLLMAEYARGEGSRLRTPVNGINFDAGRKNWYFHIALLAGDKVYDFDFGNEPRVVSLREYIQTMFLTNYQAQPFPQYKDLNDKLDHIEVELIPAADFVDKTERSKAENVKLRKLFERAAL